MPTLGCPSLRDAHLWAPAHTLAPPTARLPAGHGEDQGGPAHHHQGRQGQPQPLHRRHRLRTSCAWRSAPWTSHLPPDFEGRQKAPAPPLPRIPGALRGRRGPKTLWRPPSAALLQAGTGNKPLGQPSSFACVPREGDVS
uniref:Uncharacterized protein n=1 Tax=Anser brachyrhynchus TaxID=132585 RepID=A0A8B9CRU6_9AVES